MRAKINRVLEQDYPAIKEALDRDALQDRVYLVRYWNTHNVGEPLCPLCPGSFETVRNAFKNLKFTTNETTDV